MEQTPRISPSKIEVVRSDSSDSVFVEGYAAVYGAKSLLLSERGVQFYEVIASGAFTEALENLPNQIIDCVATFQHDRNSLLARTRSGTLNVWDDGVGLRFKFEVPNTTVGNDVAESLRRGDLTQCSFIAWYTMDDTDTIRLEDGSIQRTIKKYSELRDIALVIDPAYPDTIAVEAKRSLAEFEETEKSAADAEDAEKEASILAQKNKEIEAQRKIDLEWIDLCLTINKTV